MNTYEITQRGPGWRDSFARHLANPEDLLTGQSVSVLQKSARTTVAQFTIRSVDLILKLYHRTTAKDRLEALVLGSRAARFAESVRLMSDADFPVPELVAVMESTPRAIGGPSCVVTRRVDGVRLDELWARLDRSGRLQLARCFARYLRLLHENGLYPQDTRAPNFLVPELRADSTFVLVDLDRVRHYRTLSWARRRKNLVQVNRSLGLQARPAERLVFLKTYFESADRAELQSKSREILVASQRKHATSALGRTVPDR